MKPLLLSRRRLSKTIRPSFSRKLLFGALLTLSAIVTAPAQPKYTVTDLGTLGGNSSYGYGINAAGYVVGYSQVSPDVVHAFRRDTSMTDLGTLGGTSSYAYGINTAGQIAGYSIITGNLVSHAFRWQNGVMTDLGTLGGVSSWGSALNSTGKVVGRSIVAGGNIHAFIWDGAMTDLGTLGGLSASATGINDSGKVVGQSHLADNITYHAFLWQNGGMADLGTLGGIYSIARGINASGRVVGQASLPDSSVHAFRWENGVMSDLGALGGSSVAKAINTAGQIVGYAYPAGGGNAHAMLWENSVMTDLNSLIDSSSGWSLMSAEGINDNREISGYGFHGGQIHAFLLTSVLTVTNPAAGDLWIAGGQDTIRWEAPNGIDSVKISFSVDFESGAGSFNTIAESHPASPAYFVWDIPDSILSRKCAISLEDASDPSVYSVGEAFRIKGYRLTRVDSTGQYEPYAIGEDTWSFINNGTNMWPPPWYEQFDYADGTDPFTNVRYASEFTGWLVNARQDDFPDWPSFVRVFGVNQCYLSTSLGGITNPLALLYWALSKGRFGGACGGFAASSLLAFDRKADLQSRFGVPDFSELNDLPLSDDARKAINELWTYTLGSAQWARLIAAHHVPTNTTLGEVRQMLLDESGDNRYLIFSNFQSPPAISAHAVNPWKVRGDTNNANIVYLHVYDNNYPSDTTLAFTIDTSANTWSYPRYNWGDTIGLVLSLPSSSFLQNATLPLTPSASTSLSATAGVDIYASPSASISIHNQQGDSVAYRNGDTSFVSSIDGAVPNIPITGYPHPPIGYFLPDGEYTVEMREFHDSLAYFSVVGTGGVLYYGRTDAAPDQTDLIRYGDGIGVRNPDPDLKAIAFGALIPGESVQKQIEILNCVAAQDDSLSFRPINVDGFELENAGPQKAYDLTLVSTSGKGLLRFDHPSILLAENATHRVAPDWNDLGQVLISIDLGNDGTLDDSIVVGTTVDVREGRSSGIPSEYFLSQNYPNPFNPTTTVEYGVPSTAHVSVRIIDVLGREIALLVDGVRTPGTYHTVWDATGFPDGVYFCTMRVANRVFTTKILLVK